MEFSQYDKDIISNKLDKAQKRARVRKFNLDEVLDFFTKVETITTKLVKEYNYKNISFTLKEGFGEGRDTYEATCITGNITEDGLIDIDCLDIVRKNSGYYVSRIELNDISNEISDSKKRKEFKAKYHVNNHGNIILG